MGFAEKVYELTKKIPSGYVSTYGEIASVLGNPKAYRAVGQALRKNKSPDIIPCFRVIRSDGSIGGYQGSSQANIKKKIKRLKSEGIIIKNNRIELSKYFHKFKD